METNPITNMPVNPPFGGNSAAVDRAADTTHSAVDKVAATANDAAKTVKPAIDRVAQMAHHTVDKVADAAAPTAEWLSTQGHQLASARRTAVSDARTYVTANPWQSLGLALAAGYLLGRLARHD